MNRTLTAFAAVVAGVLVAIPQHAQAQQPQSPSNSATVQQDTSKAATQTATKHHGKHHRRHSRNHARAAAAPSGTETGAVRADSGRTNQGKANQTKSGVTDTKTGKSTLGPKVTKTRPDQGQPVTAKGDTLHRGVDSAVAKPPR